MAYLRTPVVQAFGNPPPLNHRIAITGRALRPTCPCSAFDRDKLIFWSTLVGCLSASRLDRSYRYRLVYGHPGRQIGLLQAAIQHRSREDRTLLFWVQRKGDGLVLGQLGRGCGVLGEDGIACLGRPARRRPVLTRLVHLWYVETPDEQRRGDFVTNDMLRVTPALLTKTRWTGGKQSNT